MVAFPDYRPSSIAGKWYPARPDLLTKSVDEYIHRAELPPFKGKVIAVVSPHAGYKYSGAVAGYAFASLLGLRLDLIAVVAPMHHPLPHRLISSAHQAYLTPLGPVEIDQKALNELDQDLAEALGFGLTLIREDPEHSLEITLPFLQRALSDPFQLLPVMVRDQRRSTMIQLGRSLAKVLHGRPAVLVASTDLSHFFPQQQAYLLDGEILRRLKNFDPQGILDAEEDEIGFACGKGPLASVLWAAKELGADQVKILNYTTSGDITGDYDQVVGYAAAVCLHSKNG
jgi:MEMO1 family protein